jgi:7,8-dihydropterin-6-yl-methyl-4-(beta-D-ribofuranosyl)aminobenzene 5'-phosphate synthase
MPTEEVRTVSFTIVYDNNSFDPAAQKGLRTSWGFACWIEMGKTTILFDSGGDGGTLLHNLGELSLDPMAIDAVVLSHAHGDHTGGLETLLAGGVRPVVYVPASFSRSFTSEVRAYTDLVEVGGPMRVAPGVHTTGPLGSRIVEQALAVETEEGLVVLTGCAHPGIVKMVRRAKERLDDRIVLVAGGFHLGDSSQSALEHIISDFRDMGVQRVAPCHCTGDRARQVLDDVYGDDCTLAGVGWSVEFCSDSRK